ncbi:MAG: EamA family transporter [Burkholderiales bacterium]|nr:EamA family transporter [Burkholderiales bacterium]MDE2398759.1 EamA family transporter [Burkholderiales bacterium]MDE2457241.1 EamA family transporter [Burkholderiales bacterium]
MPQSLPAAIAPGLSAAVALAVLGGAMLHALWNTLLKAGGDQTADTALLPLCAGLLALPLLAWAGLPAPASWPFVAASMCVHLGYYASLAGAYRHGDLGSTYPVMRGMAPLWVALASGPLLGEWPGLGGWLGIAGVAGGVVLLGLARPLASAPHRRALAFAVLNAAMIALYTLFDGVGVRRSGNALGYVLSLFALNALPYPLFVAWRRGGARRLFEHARRRWAQGFLGAAASIGSYAIALWAMTRAPIALVAALRETSVLFAAVLATLLLHEGFGLRRALGTGAILAGIVALRLA